MKKAVISTISASAVILAFVGVSNLAFSTKAEAFGSFSAKCAVSAPGYSWAVVPAARSFEECKALAIKCTRNNNATSRWSTAPLYSNRRCDLN